MMVEVRKMSKRLGKLVSYKEDTKESTLTFEGGVLVVPYMKGAKKPVEGQFLGQALKALKWTIKEALTSEKCVFKNVKKTKKERMNEKAIEILKKEMEKNEKNEINMKYFVITEVGQKVEGYGLYGGVYAAEPWEALYTLIYERYDYFGTTKEERDYLDILMHNKIVEENQR